MENANNIIEKYHVENYDILQDTTEECGIICINHYCFSINDWESMTQEEREKYENPFQYYKKKYFKKPKNYKVYKIKKR